MTRLILGCMALLAVVAVPVSFNRAGSDAVDTMVRVFYTGDGKWRECPAADCHASNQDWGVDSMTYTLWLHWKTTGDPKIAPLMRALEQTAPSYPAPCTEGATCSSWSDVPEWDSIAASREYEITHDPTALKKARDAFDFVEHAQVFARGACPAIDYQLADGGTNHLKTLETDANAVKAALLLYEATHEQRYLTSASTRYASIRRYFLDPKVPLYSVYVFDDGKTCEEVPHRFFASVNGDMIWSGLHLYRATHNTAYLKESLETARAVDEHLSDAHGIFTDLQAENDIVEPLVEAFYELAAEHHDQPAQQWLLRNATAAWSARAHDGTFGRFFDGPAPSALTSVWQSNGGFALEVAAAAISPNTIVSTNNDWSGAHVIERDITLKSEPITFDGSAIALIGTIGDNCCEAGRARVVVDGVETFDQTGIWQNKSSSGRRTPNAILFAWRWPKAGHHTIRFMPGVPNAKEGGAYLHLTGYSVLP
ncbi:glycoside hydrolase family 76 protein [Dyella nitratireducens]|uniref:Uncharacterized protein n=1 Tax=Dyella nitratireducens TaxID=1849580 RepID=A0ABQ1GMX1_9GAMM|nr:glycoside hydrolase family 76 protein [Dyella nitratireducens]GGA46963.1 hypothetical protein GCM10010981_40190 [Dyella nitratireducens]GLQ41521.1 hypothetical protein GCM10007902_13710 [Dyella nitratireducens]